MINNEWSVLLALLLGLLLLAVYSTLSVVQVLELRKPYDETTTWLPTYRWGLLAMFLLAVITLVPSIVYQICLVLGIEADGLLEIARVTGRVNSLLTAGVLVYLYYKAWKSRRIK